jgi:predicted ATPase
MRFERFSVQKLWGSLSYEVVIEGNRLVLVGENGTGKTTVMNLMYFFISGQWTRLGEYNFVKLTARIDGKDFELRREDFLSLELDESMVKRLYAPGVEKRIRALVEDIQSGSFPRSPTRRDFEILAEGYDLPVHVLQRFLSRDMPLFDEKLSKHTQEQLEALKTLLDCHVLYLPTYRRIEQELRRIFPHADLEEFRDINRRPPPERGEFQYLELVEFGMGDVVRALNLRRDGLKEHARAQLNALTLSYLREIIDFEYQEIDVKAIQKADETTVDSVIDRIDENILPKPEKAKLREMITSIREGTATGEHAQVVGHFFLKLLALQQKQRNRETSIRKFIEICNVYLRPTKEFVYNDTSFEIYVRQNSSTTESSHLDLQVLSSGEKQIVSLFSHLILSDNKQRFFILIDEPELSLSVPWQRRFLLDIARSERTTGLIAVTHSPFIYQNELDLYAHSINEFRR